MPACPCSCSSRPTAGAAAGALSGGGLWLPGQPPDAPRPRGGDSREEAIDYLDVTVGDAGPAASPRRAGRPSSTVRRLLRGPWPSGSGFASRAPPSTPTTTRSPPAARSAVRSRSSPSTPRSARPRGGRVSRGQDGVPAPVKTDDFWLLQPRMVLARRVRPWGKVSWGRTLGEPRPRPASRRDGERRSRASLFDIALDGRGTAVLALLAARGPCRRGTLTGSSASRVLSATGCTVHVLGHPRGRPGAPGGFDHNADWRREHQGVDGSASSGAAGEPRDGHRRAAQRVGAALDLMDDAWWGGSIPQRRYDRGVPRRRAFRAVLGPRRRRAESGSRTSPSPTSISVTTCSSTTRTARTGWSATCGMPAATCALSRLIHGRQGHEEGGDPGPGGHPRRTRGEARGGSRPAGGNGPAVQRLRAGRRRHDFGRGNSAYDRYYGDPGPPQPLPRPAQEGPVRRRRDRRSETSAPRAGSSPMQARAIAGGRHRRRGPLRGGQHHRVGRRTQAPWSGLDPRTRRRVRPPRGHPTWRRLRSSAIPLPQSRTERQNDGGRREGLRRHGGGNGIGREVVLGLLARGARVAAVDLSATGLAETATPRRHRR